jgi:hypothetical protein
VQTYRADLEHALGAAAVRDQQDHLDIVIELARRGAVSRVMYLAERSNCGGRGSGEP